MMLKSGLMIMPTRDVVPLTVTVHQRRSVAPKVFGTVIENMPKLRFGRKCVGWPRSMSPGSNLLFGPIGTSMFCVQLRL
ncbi:MAG: hypothetical protein QM736_10420 [Vicinamibacterales bacterium]